MHSYVSIFLSLEVVDRGSETQLQLTKIFMTILYLKYPLCTLGLYKNISFEVISFIFR